MRLLRSRRLRVTALLAAVAAGGGALIAPTTASAGGADKVFRLRVGDAMALDLNGAAMAMAGNSAPIRVAVGTNSAKYTLIEGKDQALYQVTGGGSVPYGRRKLTPAGTVCRFPATAHKIYRVADGMRARTHVACQGNGGAGYLGDLTVSGGLLSLTNFRSLGGVLNGGTGVGFDDKGTAWLVGTGGAGRVYTRTPASAWRITPITCVGRPDVLSIEAALHVVCRGSDNRVRIHYLQQNGTITSDGTNELGGIVSGAPVWIDGRRVAAVGGGGYVYTRHMYEGTGWTRLPVTARAVGTTATNTVRIGLADVFTLRPADRQIRLSDGRTLTGQFAGSAPVVVALGSTVKNNVLFEGTDRRLRQLKRSSTGFTSRVVSSSDPQCRYPDSFTDANGIAWVACQATNGSLRVGEATAVNGDIVVNRWRNLGGILSGGASIGVDPRRGGAVFFLGTGGGGRVYERTLTTSWKATPFTCKGRPDMVSEWYTTMVCRGVDNAVWTAGLYDTGWDRAASLGGVAYGPPVFGNLQTPSYFPIVAVVGGNNTVYYKDVNGIGERWRTDGLRAVSVGSGIKEPMLPCKPLQRGSFILLGC